MIGTIGSAFLWIWKTLIWNIVKVIFSFIFFFISFRFLANRGEINDEIERRERKKGSNLTVKETAKVFVDDIKKTLPNTKTNSFDKSMKRGINETKTSIRRGKETLKSKFRKKKTKKAKTK